MRATTNYELSQAQGNTESYVHGLEKGILAVSAYSESTDLNIRNFSLGATLYPLAVQNHWDLDTVIEHADLDSGPDGLRPVYALWEGWKTGVEYQAELETGETTV